MEKSTILTIVLLGIASFLWVLEYKESVKRITRNRLRIIGVLLFVIASFISSFSSEVAHKEKKQFEEEVIKKLEKFDKDLKIAKKDVTSEKQINLIEKTENEFAKWAHDLLADRKLREINFKKEFLDVEEREYRLNNRWKHLYQKAFDSISELVSAYNKSSKEKIEFICETDFPDSIFSKEAEDFRALVKFDQEYGLEIKIDKNCFYASRGMPCITVSSSRNLRILEAAILSICVNPEKQRIYSKSHRIRLIDLEQSDEEKQRDISMEKSDSTENYPEFIPNILKKFFKEEIIGFEKYKLRKSR